MAYTVTLSNGNVLTTIADAALDNTTSLTLLGRNYAGYGTIIANDLVHLLENAAGTTPPFGPLTGQLWYNSTTATLMMWNGTAWVAAGMPPSNTFVTPITFETLDMYNPSAPVNDKRYRIVVDNAGEWLLEGINDDGTVRNTPITVKPDGFIYGFATPTVGDNSLKMATTAFIHGAGFLSSSSGLGEVATEASLPIPPSSAPFPAYIVRQHQPYNNRPALAMRLSTSASWYFLDAAVISDVDGNPITSSDYWSPFHRFFGGPVEIGPSPANANQQLLYFVDSAGTSLALIWRATDASLHLSANGSGAASIAINASGDLSTTRDALVGRNVSVVGSVSAASMAATGAVSAASMAATGAVSAGTTLHAGGALSGASLTTTGAIAAGTSMSSGTGGFGTTGAIYAATTLNTGGAAGIGTTLSVGTNLSVGTSIGSGNDIVAGQRLRATFGAYNSGDPNAASILSDFPFSASGGVSPGSGWAMEPNGLVHQWGSIGLVAGAGVVTTSMARTWPLNAPLMIVISYLCHNNPPNGSVGADFTNGVSLNPNGQASYQNTATGGGTHGCYWYAIGF